MKKKLTARKKRWIERTVDNDRRYKYLLYNRFYLYALLALLQIAGWGAFWYFLVYNSEIAILAQSIVRILTFGCVLYIFNRHRQPSSKLGWIFVVLTAPVFGSLLYISCGEGRPIRRMRKRSEQAKRENREIEEKLLGKLTPIRPDERGEGVGRFLMEYAGCPAYTDGDIVYYPSGEQAFTAIKEAVEEAKSFILLEYFIILIIVCQCEDWVNLGRKNKK